VGHQAFFPTLKKLLYNFPKSAQQPDRVVAGRMPHVTQSDAPKMQTDAPKMSAPQLLQTMLLLGAQFQPEAT